jgi:hypothetical protein
VGNGTNTAAFGQVQAAPERTQPCRFHLVRDHDPSQVSGVGRVADGVVFSDGTVALHWHGRHPSTVVWRSIADVLAVHGHGGLTRVRWLETPLVQVEYAPDTCPTDGRG